MISIYLCEDSLKQLEYFTNVIQNFLLMHNLDEKIVCRASNTKMLLEHLEADPPDFGLYFLDICLGETINGLQLAQKIREKDPLGEIVFITSRSELCMLTFQYQVRALDFIAKDDRDLFSEKIFRCMKAAEKRYRQIKTDSSRCFPIKQGGERVFLNVDEVLYIETSKDAPHKVMIYTESKVYHTYGTMKEFEASLEKYHSFLRCHQSVLVNKKHIQMVDKGRKQILLTNGNTCHVSARYLRNQKKERKETHDIP